MQRIVLPGRVRKKRTSATPQESAQRSAHRSTISCDSRVFGSSVRCHIGRRISSQCALFRSPSGKAGIRRVAGAGRRSFSTPSWGGRNSAMGSPGERVRRRVSGSESGGGESRAGKRAPAPGDPARAPTGATLDSRAGRIRHQPGSLARTRRTAECLRCSYTSGHCSHARDSSAHIARMRGTQWRTGKWWVSLALPTGVEPVFQP